MNRVKLFPRLSISLVILVIFSLLVFAHAGAAPGTVIDFEGITEGTLVDSLSFGNGISGDAVSGSVAVLGVNPIISSRNSAVIFDGTCQPGGTPADCSGDDDDLFYPEQGNILIVNIPWRDTNDDGIVDAGANDDDRVGMMLKFDFSGLGSGSVSIASLDIMDVEYAEGEDGGHIDLYAGGEGGILLGSVNLPNVGNNGIATLPIGVDGVDFMVVTLNGSGAVDNIQLGAEAPELAKLGDFFWEDLNNNGIQDENEPGIPDATVKLQDEFGNVLDTTTTDANGMYMFNDLEPGKYTVMFNNPNAALCIFTAQNQGVDDEKDSDADPTNGMTHVIDLEAGEADLSIDAGIYCEEVESPGTGTPGYWMNHPEAWPVDEIVIGGITYSKDDAIALMQEPVKGDKTKSMFPQLVSAKLNVLIGNDDSCIADTIAAADSWMATYPVGSGVKANSDAWDVGGPLHDMLDDYNNGRLCAPHRG